MHSITPNEQTLHGYWSRELEPLFTIQSGESVRYTTLDDDWQAYDAHTDTLKQSPLRANDPLKGHALCGPVAIANAKKGMTLEVQINDIQVDRHGYNSGGGGDYHIWAALHTAQGANERFDWRLDAEAGVASNQLGHVVKMAPFMGVMGMPPDEAGQHSTTPPRTCGGNMDCKMLTVGTSLFLPIPVDGGLFSVGDGHAAQGDGEISGTAIECPMKQVDLTFILHEDLHLTTPRAKTPEGWITLGFHEDLGTAAIIATNAMLDLMMEQYKLKRNEALALASVVVDLRVTQIVNRVQGVTAVLPDDAFTYTE